MIEGLMQHRFLPTTSILRYAPLNHSSRKIVSRTTDGAIWRHDDAGLGRRCGPLAWMPDDVVFAPVPFTATGKINKKVLRRLYRAHLMAAE